MEAQGGGQAGGQCGTAAYEAKNVVLSTRLVGSRPVIHVHGATDPGDGYAAVAPDLEDVYFQRLRLQSRTA
mgnify:CR=1 FL=1